MCGVAVLDRYVSATEWRENLSGAGVWAHWNLPSLRLKYCAMLGNLEVRKVTGRNTPLDRSKTFFTGGRISWCRAKRPFRKGLSGWSRM